MSDMCGNVRYMARKNRVVTLIAGLVTAAALLTGCGGTSPNVPGDESAAATIDRGTLLYEDIQDVLDAAGDEKTELRMIAVTGVSDEGSYLRVHYQNPIADAEDAESLVREIYGFTTSEAFTDGERTTIVVQDYQGLDTNVWVRRDGLIATFSTDAFG